MERAKEREDERKARAEILAKVEQDKINRKKVQESKPAAGSSSASVSHFGESKRRMRTGTMEDSTEVKSSVTSISENARIQFRLLDGTIITEQFKSSDQLIKVREFIAEVKMFYRIKCLNMIQLYLYILYIFIYIRNLFISGCAHFILYGH